MLRVRRGGDVTGGIHEPRSAAPPVLHALTGIRAIAALWVVANHVGESVFRLLPSARVLEPVTRSGHLGVDVFFVLSGFILSYNYAGRLGAGRRAYGMFIRARVARVYPVHLFALAVMVGVVAAGALRGRPLSPDHTVWTLLGNALLLQALPGVTPWNWPSWSVSTEFAAYLIFPLAAGAVLRLSRRSALFLAALVVLAQLVALTVVSSTPFAVAGLMWIRISAEFTLGCLLWAAWRHTPYGHAWDVSAVLSLALVASLLFCLPPGVAALLAVPLLATFVVSVAGAAGVVRRVLSSRPLRWGGRISYSVYLLHSPVLTAIWLVLPAGTFTGAPVTVRVMVVLGWLIAIAVVGAATYRLVEEPARRRIRRHGGPPDGPTGPRRSAVADGSSATAHPGVA